MERSYWYGILLFVLALFLQFIPFFLPALISGVGVDIWGGDIFDYGLYATLSAFGDQALNNLLLPVTILLGGLIGGILFVPLYLGVHRLIYKRSRNYGFLDHQITPSLSRWLRRGILPTLFAVYVSMTLANILVDTLGDPILSLIFADTINLAIEDIVTIKIMLWGITGLVGTFVCCALVVPTWFLDDAGLLTSNVKIDQPLDTIPNQLPNISGVGFWLARLLKGFAGIAVIILYATTLTESIISTWQYVLMFGIVELPYLIVNLLMFPLYPIIILLLSLPLLMVLDYVVQSRQRYVKRIGEWMGIQTHFESER
ncbi:MAG: hypothetical protein Q6364_04110 [Candidatus Hermodarchaeota archaeon]|nr:hypothetical protein [Candidatus Hermodarchaeota archaeon]